VKNTSGIFGKATRFTREVKDEVRKVSWPTRKETSLTTTVVFVFAVVAAIYFTVVDVIIHRILNFIIG
jgi:preprotein translocase subunit SecE